MSGNDHHHENRDCVLHKQEKYTDSFNTPPQPTNIPTY